METAPEHVTSCTGTGGQSQGVTEGAGGDLQADQHLAAGREGVQQVRRWQAFTGPLRTSSTASWQLSTAFQLPVFRRDYWARFEQFIKQLTNTCDEVCDGHRLLNGVPHAMSDVRRASCCCSQACSRGQVFVVTGPLYLPRLTRNGYSMGFSLIGDVRLSNGCLTRAGPQVLQAHPEERFVVYGSYLDMAGRMPLPCFHRCLILLGFPPTSSRWCWQRANRATCWVQNRWVVLVMLTGDLIRIIVVDPIGANFFGLTSRCFGPTSHCLRDCADGCGRLCYAQCANRP